MLRTIAVLFAVWLWISPPSVASEQNSDLIGVCAKDYLSKFTGRRGKPASPSYAELDPISAEWVNSHTIRRLPKLVLGCQPNIPASRAALAGAAYGDTVIMVGTKEENLQAADVLGRLHQDSLRILTAGKHLPVIRPESIGHLLVRDHFNSGKIPRMEKEIAEMAKWLAPNGTLSFVMVVSRPEDSSSAALIQPFSERQREIQKIFDKAGFERLELREVEGIGLPSKEGNRWLGGVFKKKTAVQNPK